ncbi:MAG: ISL3 family transposase [Betaproteobacteria bacterium]
MIDLLRLPGIIPTNFCDDENTLVIQAVAEDSQVPPCPTCGKGMFRHGKRVHVFTDTPIEMRPVRIEITRQRFRCGTCGKLVTMELPFLDDKRRATRRLVDSVRERCLSKTFHSLSEDTGLAVNTIKNIAHDLISDLDQQVCFETPSIMGIDELKLAGGMRCIITNLATMSIFDMLEERTQVVLKPYFEAMNDREKVEWVCTDMWRPFKRSFAPFLPNAKLVIDKFHVVRMASDALETERKKYQKDLEKDARLQIKKSVRWLTLKRNATLTPEESVALGIVKKNLPDLALAYDLKESFYEIYDQDTRADAMLAFKDWEKSVPTKMPMFASLAKTVHNHFEDIFAYWDAPTRITNAYTEAANGITKVANRAGRGYSYEVIRAKVLYHKLAREIGSVRRLIVQEDPTPSSSAGSVIQMAKWLPSGPSSTSETIKVIEYGPYISTLAAAAEAGEFT